MTAINALDITTLPPEERALIALNSTNTELALRNLVTNAGLITDVVDQNGRELAHGMGMSLRRARVTIEKTGKAAREDAHAFSKAVIGEEKRLIGIIDGEEKRVLGLRDSFDAKIEAEKAAKAAIEAKRISEIKEKIEGIRKLPLALAGADAATLSAEIQALNDFVPLKEVFAEFTDECVREIEDCLETLDSLHLREVAREEEARVVAAERERVAEAERVAKEEIDKERAAMKAEREELDRRRQEIEDHEAKNKAAADALLHASILDDAENKLHKFGFTQDFLGTQAPTIESSQVVTDISYDTAETIPTLAMSVTTKTSDLEYAKAMSCQFRALAEKVDLCGFQVFALELIEVANKIWHGEYDATISKVDAFLMVKHDLDMMDHTAACIDAVGSMEVA
ncbi:hypothetical protein UFOVP275_74 [uncultured Caudovirales phage]|uniref:Uncharacterized protein n=1 Tax=uncultured Caudovirales phage TaxID=2100421 RepID=A0A6J5LTT1_9CAUD|nr:hypothetical protein UFOVP275_74 [uncultured Caudovirales phage]